MRFGDWTYPSRACGCSPELFFYLLSDFLHCDLGLLDGPLCCVKPAEVRKHKPTYRFFRIIKISYSIQTKKSISRWRYRLTPSSLFIRQQDFYSWPHSLLTECHFHFSNDLNLSKDFNSDLSRVYCYIASKGSQNGINGNGAKHPMLSQPSTFGLIQQ